jgi:phospholipase C
MIPTGPPPGSDWQYPSPLKPSSFVSLGPRIPAYVISPFVKPGSLYHDILDHTSVLKFIAEKFDSNKSYSPVVDARPVQSISAVLNFDNPITNAPAAPALGDYLAKRPPAPTNVVAPTQNLTDLQTGFQKAVVNLKLNGAGPNHPKFGELIAAIDKLPA